jgi:predicted transcriptional regulator
MLEPRRILDKLLSSNAKADLLMLFSDNPRLSERPTKIAEKIGRRPAEIHRDLKDLQEIGIVSRSKTHGSETLHYDRKRAAEIERILADYIETTLD